MRLSLLVTALVLAALTTGAAGEDWGAYSLVPASAQDFVLEAVDGGAADGTAVSINAPAGRPHQKWILVAKGAGFVEVKPAHAPSLALTAAQGGTNNGTQIEQACHQRKLPFSLIYWASDLPVLESKGLADESSWYLSIMHQGAAYAMVDGRPDQLVIESWLGSGNPKCLPETELWTFTRSALDLTRRLMRAK